MRCIDNLHVCADCGAYIANGDFPDTVARAAEVITAVKKESVNNGKWVLGDDSGDREFSWSPCDCCGSKLGGYRFAAAILYPNDSE